MRSRRRRSAPKKLLRKKTREKLRSVPLSPEAVASFERQREAFRAKFGRDPGPDDPVFFDPDAKTPQPMDMDALQRQVIEAMVQVGIDPALIYAYSKTGLMVTDENLASLSRERRGEWEAAIAGYGRKTNEKPQ
jgi:integrase